MYSLNDSLKNISLIKIVFIWMLLLFVIIALDDILQIHIPIDLVYIILVAFISYKLKKDKASFKLEISNVFKEFPIKLMIIIVVLNIFFSYGMIYLTNMLLLIFPQLDYIAYTTIASNISLVFIGSLISSIIIAPIFEELMFRGIIFNKLNKYFSIHIAILVSSIFFAICHNFGGIFSAFIFGICMCILYLKTSNIFLPMIAHGFNNLLSEIIASVDVNNMIFTNPLIILIFSILAIVSAYVLLISIKTEWSRYKE